MRKPTYAEAKARYRHLRLTAFSIAGANLAAEGFGPSVRLSGIEAKSLQAWRLQWTSRHASGSGGWDWEMIAASARRDPADFTLAIWSGNMLCGLASGRTSARRMSGERASISIHDVEANPDPAHPLKGAVAYVTTAFAEVYGGILGAGAVRVVDPLPGALPVYVRLGFTVVSKGGRPVYCEREITR
jgi:hypothetical protein